MTIYTRCIHCGWRAIDTKEQLDIARRGNIGGVQCLRCNEEALLFLEDTVGNVVPISIDLLDRHLRNQQKGWMN